MPIRPHAATPPRAHKTRLLALPHFVDYCCAIWPDVLYNTLRGRHASAGFRILIGDQCDRILSAHTHHPPYYRFSLFRLFSLLCEGSDSSAESYAAKPARSGAVRLSGSPPHVACDCPSVEYIIVYPMPRDGLPRRLYGRVPGRGCYHSAGVSPVLGLGELLGAYQLLTTCVSDGLRRSAGHGC
ncbi:hypothetical protein F4804DRAFT_218340 [Jackrogersella minutella]|nr:hypothetical protein F4804DRAFT_218340 [Jackrogersella minutella]